MYYQGNKYSLAAYQLGKLSRVWRQKSRYALDFHTRDNVVLRLPPGGKQI